MLKGKLLYFVELSKSEKADFQSQVSRYLKNCMNLSKKNPHFLTVSLYDHIFKLLLTFLTTLTLRYLL